MHILATITWVGGTLFLIMVMVPLSRREIESPAQAARLLGQVGRRFRSVAWASIVLLVLSGLFIATEQWGVKLSDFSGGGSGRFIQILQAKMGIVVLIIVLSAVHDFVLGPRVTRQLEGMREAGDASAATQSSRKTLVWLARVNLLLVLIVVALAVTLTRGSLS
ncbi:MAG: DUF4149 domain-containing protein [Chloroflexi bacterium]|nr:DUF4149 domain-containing protein [Chloroflexota bacterium]